jgi:ketosteroid isomerase-like protein
LPITAGVSSWDRRGACEILPRAVAEEENIQLLRRALEQYERTGEQEYGILDDDVVFDLSRSPFPDAGVYHGMEGVRGWFAGLDEAFGKAHYEVEKVLARDERVAVQLHVFGRGPSSGIQVDYRFVPVFTFRDGKVVRIDRYDDWAEALEAAGLSE